MLIVIFDLIANAKLQFLQQERALKEMTTRGAPIMLILAAVLMVVVHSRVLPINRLKKTNMSAAQISANAALTNSNTTLSFGNYQNVIYYINLQVGTPPQVLGVQFDTGSNTLWLPTQQAGVTPFFNTSKSSTFTNTSRPGSIQYADGSGVSGTYGTDILALSGTPISITAQYLWVTQEASMNFPPQIAGLVGMGYTTIPNFLDVAYSNNQIKTPAFALSIQTQSQQSYVYYNQIPQSIANSTFYVSVVGNTYWQVNVLGVTVGGIDMTSLAADVAVIDSGTSYFYVNAALFNNIINTFFQNCDNSLSTPECLCSDTPNWPTFAFMFQGIQAYIQPSQYIGQLDSQICTYNFGTLSTVGSMLLLGDIFFQGYTITFNKPQSVIGFSGTLGFVQNVFLSGSVTFGYIWMGFIGLAILIGAFAFCQMDQYVDRAYSIDITNTKEIEFTIDYSNKSNPSGPRNYRLKQPML